MSLCFFGMWAHQEKAFHIYLIIHHVPSVPDISLYNRPVLISDSVSAYLEEGTEM